MPCPRCRIALVSGNGEGKSTGGSGESWPRCPKCGYRPKKTHVIRAARFERRTKLENVRLRFRLWRRQNGVTNCDSCGRRLTDEDTHHLLCNGRWREKQGEAT